jgi:hypothetical protein
LVETKLEIQRGKIFLSDAYAKSLLQFSLAERKTVVKPIHLPQFYFVGTSTIVQQDKGVCITWVSGTVIDVNLSLCHSEILDFYSIQFSDNYFSSVT